MFVFCQKEREVKINLSKLALAWDELQKLSKGDDLDLGDLCWCDLYYAIGMYIEIEEDVDVNCYDDCARFETDDCFLS